MKFKGKEPQFVQLFDLDHQGHLCKGQKQILALTCSALYNFNFETKCCLYQFKQVLEVCANEVSDLSELCVKPPPLIHLGLGYNKISLIGDYLTAQYW